MTFPHSAALPQVNDPRRAGSITFTKWRLKVEMRAAGRDGAAGARLASPREHSMLGIIMSMSSLM